MELLILRMLLNENELLFTSAIAANKVAMLLKWSFEMNLPIFPSNTLLLNDSLWHW